jgi:multicomponent Na+:H+ antiporter subunit G
MIAIVHLVGQWLVAVGVTVAIVGAIGIVRFPDVYTRLHAAGVTDTGGATLAIVGLMLVSGLSLVTLKLAILWVFLMLTSPAASHALANAAFGSGERPQLGAWRLVSQRSANRAGR